MDTKNKQQHSEHDARLEQDIVNALRGRGLKEAMQQWDAEEKQRIREKKIRRNYRIKIAITSLLSPIAAAAILASVIFLGPQTWRYQIYKQGEVIARYFFQSSKAKKNTAKPLDEAAREVFYAKAAPSVQEIGKSHIESAQNGRNSLLIEAVVEMGKGHYNIALHNLNRALEETEDLATDTATESRRFNYQRITNDIRYLEGICWYMTGEIQKGTQRLQEIANSSSIHHADAQELLNAQ